MRTTLAVAAVFLLCVLAGAAGAASRPTPTPVPGGAGPRPSTEGCMREWLFNGGWRVQVTRVDPLTSPRAGWGVTTVFRNGLRRNASLHNTGVTQAFQLVLADGSVMDVLWEMRGGIADNYYRALPPGGQMVSQLKFFKGYVEGQRPTKLLIEVKRTGFGRGIYPIPDPSFRIRLDCSR